MFTMEHGDHASGSPFDGTAADKVRVARGVGQRATLRQLDLARRAPRTVAGIARLQRRLARAWPISRRGDHTMLTFRRAGAAE